MAVSALGSGITLRRFLQVLELCRDQQSGDSALSCESGEAIAFRMAVTLRGFAIGLLVVALIGIYAGTRVDTSSPSATCSGPARASPTRRST